MKPELWGRRKQNTQNSVWQVYLPIFTKPLLSCLPVWTKGIETGGQEQNIQPPFYQRPWHWSNLSDGHVWHHHGGWGFGMWGKERKWVLLWGRRVWVAFPRGGRRGRSCGRRSGGRRTIWTWSRRRWSKRMTNTCSHLEGVGRWVRNRIMLVWNHAQHEFFIILY